MTYDYYSSDDPDFINGSWITWMDAERICQQKHSTGSFVYFDETHALHMARFLQEQFLHDIPIIIFTGWQVKFQVNYFLPHFEHNTHNLDHNLEFLLFSLWLQGVMLLSRQADGWRTQLLLHKTAQNLHSV